MSKPTLCMIHEGIGDYNAIAKIAKTGIEIALDAGFAVSCVAQRLDEKLSEKVEWLKLHVPARVFAYKWLTARHYMQQAICGRTFDVIHAHQPQAAHFSDVFDCHFLTHHGHKQTLASPQPGLRGLSERTQERIVLAAENRVYRNWNPETVMFYDSAMTGRHFEELYGKPPKSKVLPCPFPTLNIANEVERRVAKASYFGEDDGKPVVGFLGGSIARKGASRLIAAAESEQGLKFLVGGSGSESLVTSAPAERFKKIGLVRELDRFYAACDVLLVPSLYEPLGLVAFEAVARGTPVIATPEVGALPHLTEFSAGTEWVGSGPLLPIVRGLLGGMRDMPAAAANMDRALGRRAYGAKLIETYEEVIRSKSRTSRFPNTVTAGALN